MIFQGWAICSSLAPENGRCAAPKHKERCRENPEKTFLKKSRNLFCIIANAPVLLQLSEKRGRKGVAGLSLVPCKWLDFLNFCRFAKEKITICDWINEEFEKKKPVN
jgi:hypothetical protein